MDEKLRRVYIKQYKSSHHKRNLYRGNNKYPFHEKGKNHIKKKYITLTIIAIAFLLLAFMFFQKKQVESRKSVGNLLLTALKPVGSTMYVWGGGWGDDDITSGADSVQIGISPRWAEFAKEQDASYDFDTTRFRRHDGLDCSGYIGWVIYNVMETRSGRDGYVMKAATMAANYAKRGWGPFSKPGEVRQWRAGDIMSMDGHVWLVIGSCEDGSVVFMHSSPPGVTIAGTLLADGSASIATGLAEKYMSTYFPDWYEKYPDTGKGYAYLTASASMSWNRKTLSDEEGLTKMSAEAVLEWMFANR